VRETDRWADAVPVPVALTSVDGVALHADWYPADAPAAPMDERRVAPVVVLVHGVTGHARSPEFCFAIARWRTVAHVLALELRGHGRSAGLSTLGAWEHLDVAAALDHVAAYLPGAPVWLVGIGLGGAACLNAAVGAGPELAGVVTVSAPAWPDYTSPAGRRLERRCRTRAGRLLLRTMLATRVAPTIPCAPEPADNAALVRAPLILVHDPADPVVGAFHAIELHTEAHEPKELWWVSDAGHGNALLSPMVVGRLTARFAAGPG
jgi:pimeloyl-ACP methyl ester carboxylesterase